MADMKKSEKGISLVGINDIATVCRIIENFPDVRFELSYLSTENSLREILPVIRGRVASVHLLCPRRDYFPNLASEVAYRWSEHEILKDANLAAECGAKYLVLHPGYIIDGLLSCDYKKRLAVMQSAGLDEFILQKENAVKKPQYIFSEKYRHYFEIMKQNALQLTEKLKSYGLCLCLENLNPRAGYLLLHPSEMKELADSGLYLCLDTGHMQVNSALFGFDCFEAIKSVLATGKVMTMHLHSNQSCKETYIDSHLSLDKYMPFYREILQEGEKTGANLILEVLEEPERNVGLLYQILL
ncbi:MAG: TIM barrel protein [Sphaerochaetaceae bacterium]|nr:TIM barrel protein [Sphaerochaetaceae bacterium]